MVQTLFFVYSALGKWSVPAICSFLIRLMLWSILNEIISKIISSPVIIDSNKQTKIARDAGEIDLHPVIMSPSFLWGQVRMTMLILLHVHTHTHTLTVCENSIISISSFSCSLGFFPLFSITWSWKASTRLNMNLTIMPLSQKVVTKKACVISVDQIFEKSF